MEPLVNEIIKNHEIDRDLTGEKVQEEVKNLRQKHNRVNDSLEENEQLVGLDWKNENLRKFNFEGIILSKEEPENQAHFEGANLLKANFRNADLSNACLNQANVKRAKFDGCNFEGLDWQDASYFEDAIISHIDESNINEAIRIYFDLEKYFKGKNRPTKSGRFYFIRKKLKTKSHLIIWKEKKTNLSRLKGFITNRFIEFLCGYGEKPWRVVRAWFITIGLSSLSYFYFWGVNDFLKNGNISVVINALFDSIYFSVVTFTTLGFGDLEPDPNFPFMRIIAMTEALFGAFLMALFVVSISRKMMR